MKRKLVILVIFCLCSSSIFSATKAPYLYYFKVISTNTEEEIFHANVHVTINDTSVGSGFTDKNGITCIATNRMLKKASAKIGGLGFKTTVIKGITLKSKDTLTIMLENEVLLLDEIELTAYTVPLIEKERPTLSAGKQKKMPVAPPELLIEYTAEELEAVAILSKGLVFSDSVKGGKGEYAEWRKFVASKIVWPDKARGAGFQEKLYFQLFFDREGTLQKVTLLRGNDPALIHAVYKAFLFRPGVRYIHNIENETVCTLPVRFSLR